VILGSELVRLEDRRQVVFRTRFFEAGDELFELGRLSVAGGSG
jgi:hypothetical protein